MLSQANQQALREIRGSPEEVNKAALALAAKEGFELIEGKWVRSKKASPDADKLWDNDPWQRWRSKDEDAHDSDTALDKAQAKLGDVELQTRFVFNDSEQLPWRKLDCWQTCWRDQITWRVYSVWTPGSCPLKGPLVLISRREPQLEVRKLQLVTRASRSADWNASTWFALMYPRYPTSS